MWHINECTKVSSQRLRWQVRAFLIVELMVSMEMADSQLH